MRSLGPRKSVGGEGLEERTGVTLGPLAVTAMLQTSTAMTITGCSPQTVGTLIGFDAAPHQRKDDLHFLN